MANATWLKMYSRIPKNITYSVLNFCIWDLSLSCFTLVRLQRNSNVKQWHNKIARLSEEICKWTALLLEDNYTLPTSSSSKVCDLRITKGEKHRRAICVRWKKWEGALVGCILWKSSSTRGRNLFFVQQFIFNIQIRRYRFLHRFQCSLSCCPWYT